MQRRSLLGNNSVHHIHKDVVEKCQQMCLPHAFLYNMSPSSFLPNPLKLPAILPHAAAAIACGGCCASYIHMCIHWAYVLQHLLYVFSTFGFKLRCLRNICDGPHRGWSCLRVVIGSTMFFMCSSSIWVHS